MEGRFVWREEYNIGVEAIDREHQQLFRIINRLFAFREEQKDNQWICQEGIKYFKGHTIQHFADEEAYMKSIGDEGLKRHQGIHRGFRENTLPILEQELVATGYSEDAMEHFLGVCAGWLIGHTLTEDQAIREKGASADDARYAAEWLESIGALDDAQYAAALVRHYSGKGYGRRRIQEKLYEKGVPRELWEGALDEMPENDGQIDDFLTGKLRGRAPDEKEKRRLTNALMRRGFPWSDIKAAWERLGDRIEED